MKWWPVLWKKFVGGLLVICPGMFLSREGPCIQMGAAIGQGMGERFFHTDREENKLLLSCGVAAGLAAAFSAPLAGTMFLLEEITFRFQIREWLTALAAAISADLMTVLVYGTRPCLWLPVKFNLPPADYPWLILFGLVLPVLPVEQPGLVPPLHSPAQQGPTTPAAVISDPGWPVGRQLIRW